MVDDPRAFLSRGGNELGQKVGAYSWRNPVWGLIALIIGAGLFVEFSNSVFGVSRFHLVPISEIVSRMYVGVVQGSRALPDFTFHLAVTLREVFIAFLMAVGFGLVIGIALGSVRLLGDAFEPLLLAWWSVPWIVLFPLLVLALGIGSPTRIAVGFLLGFTYIVFNTSAALRSVDRTFIVLARSCGYGPLAAFRKVVFPSALPSIVAGLRLGFGSTYIGVVVAGILLANSGVGFLLEWTSRRLYTAELLGTIGILLILGAIFDSVIRLMENRLRISRGAT